MKDDFGERYRYLIESEQLEPERAESILHRVLEAVRRLLCGQTRKALPPPDGKT